MSVDQISFITNLVREALQIERDAPPKLDKEGKPETFTLALPKLRISEQWGSPGSDDRQVIEMFTSKIQGGNFQQKLASLGQFVNNCDESCSDSKDVGEILANLVFLEALAAIIEDFNDKSGGFLFESLIVALAGGGARQVDTVGGRDQEVTDIEIDGRPMSLKFLYGGSKYLKGSARNLERDIRAKGQPMEFLVGVKDRDEGGKVLSVGFYNFTVGKVQLEDGSVIEGEFSPDDYGLGIYLPNIVGSRKPFARIDLGSREKVVQVANNHVSRLGDNLLTIYNGMATLSNQVNSYFLESNKMSGVAAAKTAGALKDSAEKLLQ